LEAGARASSPGSSDRHQKEQRLPAIERPSSYSASVAAAAAVVVNTDDTPRAGVDN